MQVNYLNLVYVYVFHSLSLPVTKGLVSQRPKLRLSSPLPRTKSTQFFIPSATERLSTYTTSQVSPIPPAIDGDSPPFTTITTHVAINPGQSCDTPLASIELHDRQSISYTDPVAEHIPRTNNISVWTTRRQINLHNRLNSTSVPTNERFHISNNMINIPILNHENGRRGCPNVQGNPLSFILSNVRSLLSKVDVN